ncbi:hypothetical protein RUM44_000234 [Polyplax serrata]|uniref:Uncharacterized protein n=1 Tax=Polyplax serrata TaxID=468196 RepID=A0ABR1B4W0_POLSC
MQSNCFGCARVRVKKVVLYKQLSKVSSSGLHGYGFSGIGYQAAWLDGFGDKTRNVKKDVVVWPSCPWWKHFDGTLFDKVDAYFGSFRRCNYPKVSAAGVVEIIQECGRYSRFWDIPSPWWQASTILVGVASGLSLLVGVTAAAACCVTYVVHTGTARAAGFMQLFAALLVCGGVVLYPMGWDNREIKESCGESAHIYKIENTFGIGSSVGKWEIMEHTNYGKEWKVCDGRNGQNLTKKKRKLEDIFNLRLYSQGTLTFPGN